MRSRNPRRPLRCAATLALLCLLATTARGEPPPANDPSHRGGTLRLVGNNAFGTIDPNINYSLGFAEVFYVVYDGLTAFRKADGTAGYRVVADLADALPPPLDHGTTYVFHLRPGIRFSDGRTVSVDDVLSSFRRVFVTGSPEVGFLSDLVGADACVSHPQACTLAGGIEGDAAAGTVTFHLTHPDAEFFDKLALPMASVLEAGLPGRDIGNHPAASTGPYRLVSYDPNRHMRLERNPYFRQWSADAQPDGYVDAIDYTFGPTSEAGVTAVENDQYDWVYDEKPLDRLGEIGGEFASRTHVSAVPATDYLPMNTRLYPFDHPKAREAVNYAIDRRALVLLKGGPGAASTLCQVLPRGYPAYVPYCPFTAGADVAHPAAEWQAPDLERAKRLVEESGTKGAHVTLIVPSYEWSVAMGTYLRNVLSRIGYVVSMRALDFNIQFTYIQNSNNHVQISLTDWNADYPAPSDFLRVLYSCGTFIPGSDSSINISGFCDPAIDAEMKQAALLSVTDQAAGDALWSKIDREITDRSLAANLIQDKWVDLVSTRLGNYTFSPLMHMIFSKVWVR